MCGYQEITKILETSGGNAGHLSVKERGGRKGRAESPDRSFVQKSQKITGKG